MVLSADAMAAIIRLKNVTDSSGHEHDEIGQFTGTGGGSGKGGSEIADKSAQSYAEAWNDNPTEGTTEDLKISNEELADEGSDYRIIFNEESGKFEAWTQDEIEDNFGDDVYSRKDPESGKWETASAEYFDEADHDHAQEIVDELSSDTYDTELALDDALEDMETYNSELESQGSKWRVEYSEGRDEFDIVEASEKSKAWIRPKWFPMVKNGS